MLFKHLDVCVWGDVSIMSEPDDLPMADNTALILILGMKRTETKKGITDIAARWEIRLHPAEEVECLLVVFLFRR